MGPFAGKVEYLRRFEELVNSRSVATGRILKSDSSSYLLLETISSLVLLHLVCLCISWATRYQLPKSSHSIEIRWIHKETCACRLISKKK
ncbi:unnamed protein product [Linum tenue]|uniref:Uncharacterized protein n=1 Tax=Linum tenue TaxID=586396 RepID=A0AAV0I3U9_9ROSI|nr:unnamed protein product [Linum tenue]